MTVDCFLDSNVLIYAVSSAPEENTKKATALELIANTDFGLSTQVLQEFYVNATQKIATPIQPDVAIAIINELRHLPLVHTDYPLVVTGVEISLEHRVSYWDGAILAAAQRLGAAILYTEDLNHGQHYGSVQAINPFRHDEGRTAVHAPPERPYL